MTFNDVVSAALRDGRTTALGAETMRQLMPVADQYGDLFPTNPFDARLYSTVAAANACGSPWASADELWVVARASMWVFGADWTVDHLTKTEQELDDLVDTVVAIAGGTPARPGDTLGRFLADIRSVLAAKPSFADAADQWVALVDRYVRAMAKEWRWREALRCDPGYLLPSFEEYLANTDNNGISWCNISHWIFTSSPEALAHLPDLAVVSDKVAQVLRLLNDLASFEREVEWGDLNSLMLAADHDQLTRRIAELTDESLGLLEPLRAACPVECAYLERQLGFSMGFWETTDYWGHL